MADIRRLMAGVAAFGELFVSGVERHLVLGADRLADFVHRTLGDGVDHSAKRQALVSRPDAHDAVERLARRRLAASIAAAKVAKRNNERQIELARTWNVPMLTVVPASMPTAEMHVYEEDAPEPSVRYGGLSLVTA